MDFLFEENLLESMEIVSFEERTPEQIIRENAHYMLDIEMDFQEIMEENYVEAVTEGFAGTVMDKIKAVFRKIKEYISKFIEWVKNLFKKKDAVANSDSKSEEPKNNSGSTKSNSKQDANIDGDKSSNNKKEEPKNNSSSNSNHTTKHDTEPDVITEVKLLDASKLKSVFDKAAQEITNAFKGEKFSTGNIANDVSELRTHCDKVSSDAIKQIDNSCWVNARLNDVVKEVGGKKQYFSVNKEILDFLEHTASKVDGLEKDFESLVALNAQRQNLSEAETAQLVTASKCITSSIIKIVAHIKTCYNTDMNNRQTLMVQLKRKNRKR